MKYNYDLIKNTIKQLMLINLIFNSIQYFFHKSRTAGNYR